MDLHSGESDIAGSSRHKLAVRTRRSKGKSRLGCTVCKARKVKCDELRPACTGCKAQPYRCIYSSPHVPKWRDQVTTFTLPSISKASAEVADSEWQTGTAHKLPLPVTAAVQTLEIQMAPGMAEYDQVFDKQDVLLMLHFTSTTSTDLLGSPTLWAQDAIQLALQHTFLMHAVLALAARHLQEKLPSLSSPHHDYKVREAHHLQKSLSTFSPKFNTTIHEHQDAVLATSFLLFFHSCSVIPTTLPTCPCADPSFTFLRGIQSIVADGAHIAHSGRYSTLVEPRVPASVTLPRGCSSPAVHLMQRIYDLPLNSPYLKNIPIYTERVQTLAPHLSPLEQGEESEDLLLSVLRWQALCPHAFVDLINAHDHIALVILAHYYAAVKFIISRSPKKWWWLQKKPGRMVQVIADYVGPAWTGWMEWARGEDGVGEGKRWSGRGQMIVWAWGGLTVTSSMPPCE